jgi:hypothetical protein
MDTFLLESDTCSYLQEQAEKELAEQCKAAGNDTIEADMLYKDRLDTSLKASKALFDAGKVCRIVYSGAKSYHLLVRIKPTPETLEEYKWVHSFLCDKLSSTLEFDNSTSDPARLTRSPLKLDRESEAYGLKVHGVQDLICENWSNVLDIDWRPLYMSWTRRPLRAIEQAHGKRLLPTKPEYRKAAEAIIDGTFWTDTEWDGRRQKCFFAAYRVLRMLGYSHADLWEGGIMCNGVESYKHGNEITYWKTRGTSNIIKQIDEQIDTYESQEDDEDEYDDEY